MEFAFEAVGDFNDYILEDKSQYPSAKSKGFIDADDDFLIGNSGGFLMNINFKFINTHLLSPSAQYYIKYGTYTKDPVDSVAHKKFRRREEYRRKAGFEAPCKLLPDGTVTTLRITGEHYNFLNFVEILRLETSSAKSNNTATKKTGFPRLFDSQYWWYKTKEFSKANGFNLLVCKTRRAGFSYMEGKGSANTINLIPNMTVLLAAWDKKYLTTGNAIANMALEQIDFYETQTPFRRGILSRDIENIKLGYKDKYKHDGGYKSKLVTVSTFNNPNAAVGKDSTEIKIEERGTLPNFDDFMKQTEPTLKTGSYITGQAIVFGTVNSSSETAAEFEHDFYNPAKWRFMPFENVWDRNRRHTVCGFYKPFWWGLEGEIDGQLAMDLDGNTNYDIAIKVAEAEHKYAYTHAKNLKDYIDFKGQYGNCPADSFSNSSSNMFTSQELELHAKRVKNTDDFKFYRDGIIEEIEDKSSGKEYFKFVSNEQLRIDGRVSEIHPYITSIRPNEKGDNLGCIRMWFPPIKPNGAIPDNLYRIWVDPFGVDKEKGTVTRDNSFAGVKVYMRDTNLANNKGDIVVASYVGRPLKQEQLSRLVYKLAMFYNARVFSENDRGQINTDFKHWKKTHLLVAEPSFAWDIKLQGTGGRGFGVSMGSGHSNRRLKGLELYYEWLYTVRETIDDVPIYNFNYIYDEGDLNELLNFSLNGNFDRISTMIVGMYDVKEMQYLNLKPKPKHNPHTASKSVFERAWYN